MNFSRTVAPYKRVRLPPTNDMQYFGNLSEQSPLQSQYCFDTSADAHFSFRTSWEPTPMDMLLSGSSLYDFQQQIDPSMSPPPIKQEASEDECDIPETPGINDDTQITSMQSWQEDPTGLSGEFDVQSGLMILSREQTDQLESQLSGTPRSEGNGNEFETSHDTSIPSSDVASRDMFHVGHSFQPEVSDHYWHPPVVPAYPYAPAQAHLGSGPGSNPLHSSSSATTNLQFPSDHFYVVSFGRKVSQDSDADLRGGPFRGFLDADPNFPEPSRHPSDNLDDELNHKIPAMPPGTGNYTVQQAYARSRGSEVASLPSGDSTSAGELNLQISGVASLPASAYNPPRSPLRRKSKRKLTIQPSGESSEKAPRRSAHRRKSPSAEGTDSSSPPKKSPRDEDLGHIPKSFKVRFKPRKEELESQSNDRAVQSVKSWYNRLNEYDYFYQSQGNGNVPQKYGKLGIWVNKQRMEKKSRDDGKTHKMYDWKIERLNEANFVWAKPKGEASWEAQFAALREYKNIHGDCNVPTKYRENKPLGRWVSTQRSNYKRYKDNTTDAVMQRRFERLEGLGFTWARLPSPASSTGTSSSSQFHESEV